MKKFGRSDSIFGTAALPNVRFLYPIECLLSTFFPGEQPVSVFARVGKENQSGPRGMTNDTLVVYFGKP